MRVKKRFEREDLVKLRVRKDFVFSESFWRVVGGTRSGGCCGIALWFGFGVKVRWIVDGRWWGVGGLV